MKDWIMDEAPDSPEKDAAVKAINEWMAKFRCSECSNFGGMILDGKRFCQAHGYAHIGASLELKPTLIQRALRMFHE